MNDLLKHRFERLVDEHRDALLAHALRLTHDRDLAEDVVQTALVRAARAFERFDGDNFRGWAIKIATNVYINEHKREARVGALPLEAEDDRICPDPSPFERLAEREMAPEIVAALRDMPPQLARTFMLAEVAGLSHNEVAAAEAIPVGTVQSRTFRARAFLRARLAGYAREHYGVEVEK